MSAFSLLVSTCLSISLSDTAIGQSLSEDLEVEELEAEELEDQARGFRDSCHDSTTVRPNFLFIMLDDLGFGDISATTGQFPTPNMDALYLNGISLSHHYVHLMCSPSRTQFITGRYAMNLGFGEFLPWNNLEAGGIPVGQPTVANWLSEYGDYTTYMVGKWHMGYANTQLTPKANGFQHFYGFYQGAIDYVTKVYNDIEDGALAVFDFFEDEEACYQVIDSEVNTMDLYSHKIRQYLDAEGQKAKMAMITNDNPSPFFLMATLQSMHAPFPTLYEYQDECKQLLSSSSITEEYKEWRQLYCELTLKTDQVVGEIVDGLKSNGLYGNTMIVFTADNGGDTDNGASNYPFRGTKGEFYEGNTRVITSIAGGFIEKQGLGGKVRDELFSNLDWTPTLLQFAGYLPCIDPRDYSWDGRNNVDMILNTPEYDRLRDSRKSLILNIGDTQLRSARIIVEHNKKWYKYMKSDSESSLDRWIYSGRLADVWTVPDYGIVTETKSGSTLPGLKVIEFEEDNEKLMFSQHYNDKFLFSLTDDPSELYNLLHPDLDHFDDALNKEIVQKCEDLLAQWLMMNTEEMFSPPMDWLHQRLPSGDPQLLGDGKFVRPFLSDKEYRFLISDMLEDEDNYIPQKLRDIYLNPWIVPGGSRVEELEAMDEMEEMETDESVMATSSDLTPFGNPFGGLKESVAIPMMFGFVVILIELMVIAFYRFRIKGDDIDEYMMAKENSADRNRVEIAAGYGSISMERR